MTGHARARVQVAVHGGTLSGGAYFGPGVELDVQPGARLRLGSGVYLSRGVVLHVSSGAELVLGKGVFMGHETVIMAAEHVSVGPGTAIAERVSIRDHDHVLGKPPHAGGLVTSPVRIGPDVWIAAGVVITRGCEIGQGAVIGAGAVVTRDVAARVLAMGAPARPVKQL